MSPFRGSAPLTAEWEHFRFACADGVATVTLDRPDKLNALTHARTQRSGAALATTGVGPDLMAAAREATRALVHEVSARTGLSPLDAYLLASVAADLKISEVVDAPNWVVSAHLELAYL